VDRDYLQRRLAIPAKAVELKMLIAVPDAGKAGTVTIPL
jgi:hypothetical protein